MSPISDFTNEIYDQDSLNDAFKDGADVWTVFLGVVVTLLPKIIPRVMPAIVPEQTLKERFDDENYVKDIENLFREKFLQNLGAIENLVRAWKDNTLEPEQFGLSSDSFLAKDDLIVGDTEGFQNDILSAITFLQDRMQRSADDSGATDGITRLANSIWKTATTAYTIIASYMRH